MSEKKEYWQELFGDDFTGDIGGERNLSNLEPPPEDNVDGESFPVDESLFAPMDETFSQWEDEPDIEEDTSVIPTQVTKVSAYTNGYYDAEEEDEGYEEDLDYEEDPDYDPEAYPDGDDEDYDDEYDEDPEYTFDQENPRAIRITRKKRTGLLGGLMYAAFILGVSVILASVAWMLADDMLGLTKDEAIVEIEIPQNFTIEQVTEILYAEGVINYRFLFQWFANMYGAENRIQPGIYNVALMDYRAVINSLNQRTGQRIEVNVLIPEGRTMREIFEILQDHGVATVESLEYAAENGTFDFPFINVLPPNTMNRLEGYLFPDTYTFFMHQDPEQVIRSMLRNFNTRMQANYVFDLVEESEFTLHEIVNIASMIEKEIANRDEGPVISSVIHNRLNRDMILQIDATIQYMLEMTGVGRREILHAADLQIDSPYNTYLYTGLPYGPIGNPGVASILAALQPANTNYIFYALHVDGHHAFFPNYEQHLAFQRTPNFAHYGRIN